MNYTLITGASKGIGKAIAYDAANRGMNLLLVARSKNLLEELSNDISAKNVSVKIFVADLLEDDAPQKIFAYAKENSLNVNMLVNNAGVGLLGAFAKQPLQKHLDIMKLNMDACVKMAYEFLQSSDPGQRRYILNTVSTAAFQPVPGIAIYSATKAFMLSFSRALRDELGKRNVYVTALCPGGTESEFFIPAQMEEVIKKRGGFIMRAEPVAKAGLDAVLKNKSIAVPGLINKLGVIAAKHVPHDWVVQAAGRVYR